MVFRPCYHRDAITDVVQGVYSCLPTFCNVDLVGKLLLLLNFFYPNAWLICC